MPHIFSLYFNFAYLNFWIMNNSIFGFYYFTFSAFFFNFWIFELSDSCIFTNTICYLSRPDCYQHLLRGWTGLVGRLPGHLRPRQVRPHQGYKIVTHHIHII